MTRIYILLLRCIQGYSGNASATRCLAIFEQSEEKFALMMDGFVSLLRQHILRRQESPVRATADGAPLFCLGESDAPPLSALMFGVVDRAFSLLAPFGFTLSHRWSQTELIVGSHHPSPSHLLGAAATAQPGGSGGSKSEAVPREAADFALFSV